MTALWPDADETEINSRGHRWFVSWHPTTQAPDGEQHGAAGVCVSGSGDVVLISTDGCSWDFPAGRP